jgi:adenylosuccinate lyase
MIPRYALPEMSAIWSDRARFGYWLEIEILVVEAWARLGVVPEEDAREVRARASFDVERVFEREAVTKHDVAAFVQEVAASVGPAGRWVHHGLTSSDVLDTALALQLREAVDLLLGRLERLLDVTKRLALAHRDTVMAGRTHGVVAEPTSFGHKAALWAFQLDRDRERLRRAREAVAVGAISGAVGTYAQVDPRVEEEVCARLGLRPVEASNQIVARDRHAELMSALAITASTLDAVATEIRHLARTEVREVQESFAPGQKGSSAMPHKRNPVRCERITGLARVIRGHLQTALENTVLWHERDISHSSAERVILPDSTMAIDFMLAELTDVLEGLEVHPDRMRRNLDVGGGLAYSQNVLLALIEAGMSREDAYAIVQAAAASAWDEGSSFRDALAGDDRVRALLGDRLGELFDPVRALRNLDVVFDRLAKVVVEGSSSEAGARREGSSSEAAARREEPG